MGQPYAEFWTITLREYDLRTRALVRAEQRQIDVQRGLNQELASLITYAFHDPKNMPDYTKSSNSSKPVEVDPKLATEQLRAAFIGLSLQSSKG